MRTRTFALTLAALLVSMALLAGCQSAPATPEPTATTEAVAAAPTAAQAAEPTATAEPAPTTAPQATPTSASAPVSPAQPLDVANLEVSWDQEMSIPGLGDQTMKAYVKKGKSRLEMSAMGEEAVMIIDETAAYMYLPAMNMAMKIPFDMAEEQAGPDVTDVAEEATQGRLIRTETIDGKVADVYEAIVDGEKTTTWIWQEKGFPLRVETETDEGTVVIVMKNITFGGLDDSLFELPAGVEVTDISEGMGIPTPEE